MVINTSSPPELIVVVDPKAGVRAIEGRVTSIVEGVDVRPVNALLDSWQAVISPLYGVSEEWFKNRTSFTTTMMGVGQPLDLSIFYKIITSSDNLKLLVGQLAELSLVQAAYIKPGASLPFIDEGDEEITTEFTPAAATKDFTKFQEYLDNASKGGIDALFAWRKEGGRGEGINIIDIEGAWRFSHEDLAQNLGGCVGGIPIKKKNWRKHGTAVLGVLGGDHNSFGIVGICPEADVRTISIFGDSNGDPSPDWGSAAAIRLAADLLLPGGIILLELHRPGPSVDFKENENTQLGYIPVEWWPCDMAAILYATSRNILVVEAGGNGQENLGDDIYNHSPIAPPHGPFPPWWKNPFQRKSIDTGAILVGAGAPPPGTHGFDFGPDRSRLQLSNFGRVIDTQGWGAEVATCGGNNDLNRPSEEDRHYTRRFNGTSSASAMIAGALACLQGVLRKKGITLTPLAARALLHDDRLGSPQQDGPEGPARLQPIGPRPDLKKLIEHF